MIFMDFRKLDLTENEGKAYETLLKIGKSSASQISKESSVPYGRIYDILASLERKNLVKVVPEKTKKFVPSDPQQLKEYISLKKKELDEVEREIIEYKAVYERHEKEPIEIVKGKNNFYKLVREMKKPQKYEYNVKYEFDLNPEFMREAEFLIKKSGDFKTLGRIDSETEKNVRMWRTISKNIKAIENEGVALSIVDDEQIMITLIKSNTNLLIRDKPFIKLIKEFFLNYYKTH